MNQSRSKLKSIILLLLSFLIVGKHILAFSSTEKNFQKKEATIKESKEALKKNLPATERMKQLSNIVISYYQDIPDSALVYAQKMAHLIDEVEEKEVLNRCDSLLTVVTNNFISRGLLNHAEPIAESVLRVSKKLKNKKSEAKIVQNLVRINGMQRDLNVAKKYAEEGLELFKDLKDTLNYARTLTNLGNILLFQAEFQNANLLFLEALDIYKDKENFKGIASCYNSLSLVMKGSLNYKKTDLYLDKAISTYKKLNDNKGIGDCYINKGNLQHQFYKKDSSKIHLNDMLNYYQKAYENYSISNFKSKENLALGNVGTTYSKLGEYKKAIQTLNKVIDFNEKNSTNASYAVYYALGESYLKTGEFQKTIDAYEKSIALRIKGNITSSLHKCYARLAEAYYKIGDRKNALKNQNLAYSHLNKFVSETNTKEILALEQKYENIENEKKLIQQSLEIEQNNNALSNRKWGLVSLGSIATMLGMGMIFYFRRNKRINKFNKSLEQKNQFIQTLNTEINHRAKNHFQFISNLLRMQSKRLSDEDAVSALEESNRRIQAMSIVYNKLLAKNNNSNNTIIFSDYIKELAHNLEYTFQEKNLKIKHDISNLELDAELAANFGILINELITNATKHAFNNQPNPLIKINFKNHEKFYHLELIDNGNGTPELINDNNHSSFGIQLIQIITEQLKGSLNISKTDTGLNFSFDFKK